MPRSDFSKPTMRPESVQTGEWSDSLGTIPMRLRDYFATPYCEELAAIEQQLAGQSTQPSVMRLALPQNIRQKWDGL